jgi:competence protein ComEA
MNLKIAGKQFDIKLKILIPVLIVIIGVIGVAGYFISTNNGSVIIGNSENLISSNKTSIAEASQTTANTVSTAAEKIDDEIQVYVTGCVNSPGIVKLKKGQLIDDAISAAGGPTKDADISNINLVYKLSENVMLYVKSKKENQLASNSDGNNSTSKQGKAGTGVIVKSDSTGIIVNSESVSQNTKGKVNINTAGMEELCTIPWVGESIAKDIIEFRQKNGPFKKPEDIMKISGIKQSKYNKMKDSITV